MRTAELHFNVSSISSLAKWHPQTERIEEIYIHPEDNPFVNIYFPFCLLTLKCAGKKNDTVGKEGVEDIPNN